MNFANTIGLAIVCLVCTGRTVLAGCEAELCEFDCKEKCRVKYIGGSYVDNACYNTCLSSEQACKAGIPAARLACQASADYQQAVVAAKEARDLGMFSSYSQCRDINSWATRWANRSGGAIGKQIFNTCGCFLCEQAASTASVSTPSAGSYKGCLSAEYVGRSQGFYLRFNVKNKCGECFGAVSSFRVPGGTWLDGPYTVYLPGETQIFDVRTTLSLAEEFDTDSRPFEPRGSSYTSCNAADVIQWRNSAPGPSVK